MREHLNSVIQPKWSFLKWLEMENGEPLFLTDQEIFSERGLELFFSGNNPEKALEHQSIRLYYGNAISGLGKETEAGERYFWDLEKLPPAIREKMADFDRHWGKTFEELLPYRDLYFIVTHAKKRQWWEKALRTAGVRSGLGEMIGLAFLLEANAPNDLRRELWNKYGYHLEDGDTLTELLTSLYVPDKIKNKIWVKGQKNFEKTDLIKIAGSKDVPKNIRLQAARLIGH